MHIDLVVIYTDRLAACRDFYTRLGLSFVKEQHGTGPEHYAAVLDDGAVVELYPAVRRPATGHLRLGLTAPAGSSGAERRTLTDPDGRTVVLTPRSDRPDRSDRPGRQEGDARAAVARTLGPDARTDTTVFPGGDRHP